MSQGWWDSSCCQKTGNCPAVETLVDPFTHQDVIAHTTFGEYVFTPIEHDQLSAGQVGLKQFTYLQLSDSALME